MAYLKVSPSPGPKPLSMFFYKGQKRAWKVLNNPSLVFMMQTSVLGQHLWKGLSLARLFCCHLKVSDLTRKVLCSNALIW